MLLRKSFCGLGPIEPGDHIFGRNSDGVTEFDEYFNSRIILSRFQHAYIFPRNTGMCRHFLLGKAGFQTQFTKFFSQHIPDAIRRGSSGL
jgi:hypothetical protein